MVFVCVWRGDFYNEKVARVHQLDLKEGTQGAGTGQDDQAQCPQLGSDDGRFIKNETVTIEWKKNDVQRMMCRRFPNPFCWNVRARFAATYEI